jgi:chromosome segregation ATPase
MSDDQIKKLTDENEQLKKQAEQNSKGVEGLLAQLDAHKGNLSEAIQTGLNLRTQLILFQKENKRVTDFATDLQNKLDAANKKIAELEAAVQPT